MGHLTTLEGNMSYYFPSINTNFFRAGCSLFAKLTALFISFYWEGRICAIKFDYHLNSRGRASLNFSATYQAEDSTALNVTYVIFYIGYLNFFPHEISPILIPRLTLFTLFLFLTIASGC